MKPLHPPTIYIVDTVLGHPVAKARMERVTARITCNDVRTVTEDELERVIAERGWRRWQRPTWGSYRLARGIHL